MSLEAVTGQLSASLAKLHDAFSALQLTLNEDRPTKGESALADMLGDSALEVIGMLHEARQAAVEAQSALAREPDFDRARRALSTCQKMLPQIEQKFWGDLIAHERLADLAHFASERGGEWPAWARATKQRMEQCRQPLQETSAALANCWQEIVEHFVTGLWIADRLPPERPRPKKSGRKRT